MNVEGLQNKGVIEILVYLHKHGKATRTDLRDNVNAVLETIYKTSLPALKRMGLIEEKKNGSFPFAVEIFLSKKGEEVAEKLAEVAELLMK